MRGRRQWTPVDDERAGQQHHAHLGVNAGLVGKGAGARHIIVKGDGDPGSAGHVFFQVVQKRQVVA